MVFPFWIFSALVLVTHGHLRSDSKRAFRNSSLGANSTTKRVPEEEPQAGRLSNSSDNKSSVRHLEAHKVKSTLNESIQTKDDGSSFQACDSLKQVPKFVINADASSARFARLSETVNRMGLDVCRVQADLADNCNQTFENVCGTSHRKIWRYMDRNNISLAFVMEDDALGKISPDFCDYMSSLVTNMSSSDAIDVARLHTWDNISLWYPDITTSHASIRHLTNDSPDGEPNDECPVWGTAGYLMTLRGARASLESWTPKCHTNECKDYFPVDHYHDYSAVKDSKMKVKCVVPPVFDVQNTSSYRTQNDEPHQLSQGNDERHYSSEEKWTKSPKLPVEGPKSPKLPVKGPKSPKLPVKAPKVINASNSSDVSSGRPILVDYAELLPDCVDPGLVAQCADFMLPD